MGTPKGGVISPPLVNIALYDIEDVVTNYMRGIPLRTKKGIAIGKRDKLRSISLI